MSGRAWIEYAIREIADSSSEVEQLSEAGVNGGSLVHRRPIDSCKVTALRRGVHEPIDALDGVKGTLDRGSGRGLDGDQST